MGGPSPLLSRPAVAGRAPSLGTTSVQWVTDGQEWLGKPGRTTGSVCRWLRGFLATHGASSPGRRRPEGRQADFPPCTRVPGTGTPGRLPSSCPHGGSLEVLAAPSPGLLSRCPPLRRCSQRGTASPWRPCWVSHPRPPPVRHHLAEPAGRPPGEAPTAAETCPSRPGSRRWAWHCC